MNYNYLLWIRSYLNIEKLYILCGQLIRFVLKIARKFFLRFSGIFEIRLVGTENGTVGTGVVLLFCAIEKITPQS